MDNAVLMEVESLRRATLAGLREKYQEVFREETRSRHREHLFRRIAWRLQALAEGDLFERARGRASQIAQDADLRKVAPRDAAVTAREVAHLRFPIGVVGREFVHEENRRSAADLFEIEADIVARDGMRHFGFLLLDRA